MRKVDQMEDYPIKRGGGRPKSILGKTSLKDLILNGYIENLVFDRVQ